MRQETSRIDNRVQGTNWVKEQRITEKNKAENTLELAKAREKELLNSGQYKYVRVIGFGGKSELRLVKK